MEVSIYTNSDQVIEKEVIESIPLEDRAEGIKEIDLNYDSLPVERTLRIQWCNQNDVFQFKINL